MPSTLTERQKDAQTLEEMELQSLLASNSDSDLETKILVLNHLLTKQYLINHSTKKNKVIHSVEKLLSLTPAKFKQMTQTTHVSFGRLCELIKDDQLFHNKSNNKQRPMEIQLAIWPCCLGSNGNGAAIGKILMTLEVGEGTVSSYLKKFIQAILNLKDHSVKWPSEAERFESSQIMQLKGFSKCIDFLDWTTIPLSQKAALDGDVYFDCKKR